MTNAATQTGDTPIIYKLNKLSSGDRERLLILAQEILDGKVDTVIMRKNFKGAGLWIKGAKYTTG